MGIEIIKAPEYKIRKIREIKNYSQDYLAQKLGLSVRAYSKIETGETQLTIRRLNQISLVLEVTPIEILSFDERKIFTRRSSDRFYDRLSYAAEQPVEYINEKIQKLEEELEVLRASVKNSPSGG